MKEIRRTIGKNARQKKKTAQRNNYNLLLSGSKYLDPESPHIKDGQENEASDKFIDQQDLPRKRESALKEEIISLKSQLECASIVRQMLQVLNEEQENEILKLRQQVEEGRKSEEPFTMKCLEKEEQHQVEVNILKGKLAEKDKLLDFKIVLISWMIFLAVKGRLLSKLVLVFMNLLKLNLAHKVRQGTPMRNQK